MNAWSHEEHRVIDNLAQHYEAWRDAKRALAPGNLQWKRVKGHEYLYRIVDARGSGHSLGPRSAETEALYEAHKAARHTESRSRMSLSKDVSLYRALHLPRIPAYAADLLRELDIGGWLEGGVLAVGTTAMPAYELEAGSRFATGLDATDDFDMTWAGLPPEGANLLAALKQVDGTYAVNTERPFQVRNAHGFEVELLLPEALMDRYPATERFRPIPLKEQDWLILGQPVSQVVVGTHQKAARLVVPDPRFFALQKIWLSDKPERKATKKPKDLAQGMLLLDAVERFMPQYHLGGNFTRTLPEELKPAFERWKDERSHRADLAASEQEAAPVRKRRAKF